MWLLPAEKRCSQVRLGASRLGSAGRVAKVTRREEGEQLINVVKRERGY